MTRRSGLCVNSENSVPEKDLRPQDMQHRVDGDRAAVVVPWRKAQRNQPEKGVLLP